MLHSWLIDAAKEMKRNRECLLMMEMQLREEMLKVIQHKDTTKKEREILVQILITGDYDASEES